MRCADPLRRASGLARAAPSETPAAPQRVWLVIGNLFNLIILLCLLSRRRRTCVFGAEAFFSQSCAAANLRRRCLLWVKSGHRGMSAQCLLYPQKRTLPTRRGMSALCQKRTHAVQQNEATTAAGNCELIERPFPHWGIVRGVTVFVAAH